MASFRVNEPNVVYEAFGEEVVLVNLDTGKYYSISGTGPTLWNDLARGFEIEQVVARIQRVYTGDNAAIATDVSKFAERLLDEQLLVPAVEPQASSVAEVVAATGARPSFVSPVIENYDDMQDLLVLDPIHDVDASGWPVVKKIAG
jgi:hypothetical protein